VLAAGLGACAGSPGPAAVDESFELDSFRAAEDIGERSTVVAVNEWGDLRTRTSERATPALIVSAMIQKIGTRQDEFEIRIRHGTDATTVDVVPLVAEPRGRVDLTLLIPPGRRLEATTRDGLAELKYKGDITAQSRGGHIAISTPAHARARSETGDITVKLSGGNWRSPLSFTSASGDIKVIVPANADLLLRARTQGTIDMAIAPDSTALVREGGRLETALGAGGPELVIDSGSGDVQILPLAGSLTTR
jgi:hypothetical protein